MTTWEERKKHRWHLMRLDKLHKLKSIHTTTNISKLSPLSPIPNPKDKNPSTLQILHLCTNLICKSTQIFRGEIKSRIKHITPYSCTMKASEILDSLMHNEHTRYYTADEFKSLKKEFRIRL